MAAAQKNEGYISKATLSNVRVSPRRARLVVDLVRGRKLGEALSILDFTNKKTAPMLKKLLLSAAANAKEQASVDVDELFVKRAWVNEGRTLRRFIPRAQGRATPVRKRHSTITVLLDEVGA
ncbi:MAG: 50S ribosomal protein L22 [Bdellovibrionales bacterium]|nr:50S ribosomal protein L22 [Bdellovibrionales bacterium]